MPQIKSDLTNKTLPGTKMREFSIPDESGGSGATQTGPQINWDQADALMRERGLPPLDRNALSKGVRPRQHAENTEQEISEFERQVKEAKQAKLTGRERISGGAKQRIEMLCGISRMQRVVDIDGNKWVLQTLRGKDQREIWVAAAEFQNTVEFPFELRKQTLARALVSVAETDMELFLNSNSMQDKLDFIELQDEEVLNRLYSEFNKLIDESKTKYAIKSEADAAALVEDLKK
jgi:hypothetical protein